MWPYREETGLQDLEEQLKAQLGRELTPREKFYVALSQACIDNGDNPEEQDQFKAD